MTVAPAMALPLGSVTVPCREVDEICEKLRIDPLDFRIRVLALGDIDNGTKHQSSPVGSDGVQPYLYRELAAIFSNSV